MHVLSTALIVLTPALAYAQNWQDLFNGKNLDGDSDRYPSGSVYLFTAAKKGVQKPQDWNSLDIESRNNIIRVKLNGEAVAESAGDPTRSKVGPIGLQLHDQFTFVMFRHIRI